MTCRPVKGKPEPVHHEPTGMAASEGRPDDMKAMGKSGRGAGNPAESRNFAMTTRIPAGGTGEDIGASPATGGFPPRGGDGVNPPGTSPGRRSGTAPGFRRPAARPADDCFFRP